MRGLADALRDALSFFECWLSSLPERIVPRQSAKLSQQAMGLDVVLP